MKKTLATILTGLIIATPTSANSQNRTKEEIAKKILSSNNKNAPFIGGINYKVSLNTTFYQDHKGESYITIVRPNDEDVATAIKPVNIFYRDKYPLGPSKNDELTYSWVKTDHEKNTVESFSVKDKETNPFIQDIRNIMFKALIYEDVRNNYIKRHIKK